MPFIIYFDEFEVNNLLESHAGLKKVGLLTAPFHVYHPNLWPNSRTYFLLYCSTFAFDCNDSRTKLPSLPENQVTQKRIHLSSAEIRCLLEILPLIIADLVPVSEQIWEAFSMLRNIIFIIFSPNFHIQICDY